MNYQNFTRKDAELLNKETVYQGYFIINKYQIRHRLFAGGWSEPITREVFERGHAAAALLFDPLLDKVVLIEQFRIGALEQGDSPWLLELVAGIIGQNETPMEVAIRETQEEAGLIVKELISICEYLASPGACTETIKLYCAHVAADNAGGIHGLTEEHEDIRVYVVDIEEAYRLVQKGLIRNAPTIIALQWLKLHEKEVKQKWLKKGK